MPLAILSLGANLPSPAGPPEATLAAALTRLASFGRITACSSLYSTAPVGYRDQPHFLNSAVSLETRLSPLSLLSCLLELELAYGRDRLFAIRDGPRTLDLDLALYGDFVLCLSGLELPHPRFAERAFVLVPLIEIAPELRDPRTGRTVSELLQALRSSPSASPVHAADAVVKIENGPWRAAVDGAASGAAAAARGSADPDHG